MSQAPDVSRADATRARLLTAATAAFAEKGFHATTTRDIASAAGMSPAALYVHHRSKEELLFLISKEGHEDVLDLLRTAAGEAVDPTAALREAIRRFSEHHARGHVGARLVNYELSALSPDHLVEIRAMRHEIEEIVRRLVAAGVDAGQFEVSDQAAVAAALLSLGVDLARWYREGGRWTPEEIADRYAEMALRIVGARAS